MRTDELTIHRSATLSLRSDSTLRDARTLRMASPPFVPAAILAVLLAMIGCCAAAVVQPTVDPAFPSIPAAYTATISANFGVLNYTLAYTEAWSVSRHNRHVQRTQPTIG